MFTEYGINPKCPQCKIKMSEVHHLKWECKECGYSLEIRNWVHGENQFIRLYDRVILDVVENGRYKQYSFREFGKKFLGIKIFGDEAGRPTRAAIAVSVEGWIPVEADMIVKLRE